MATALFPKKKTLVTYGRRSAGKAVPRATIVTSNAGRASLSAESFQEDLKEGNAANDESDDELPSIASIGQNARPAGNNARRARVPEVVVTAGSASKPSAEALGKRRMTEDDIEAVEAISASKARSSSGTSTATSKARVRTISASNAVSFGLASAVDSDGQGEAGSKRRKIAQIGTGDATIEKHEKSRSPTRSESILLAEGTPDATWGGRRTSRGSSPLQDRRKATNAGGDRSRKAEATANLESSSLQVEGEGLRGVLAVNKAEKALPAISVSNPSSPRKDRLEPVPSPTRTERISDYSMSPPPSPPDLPIPLNDEPLGFGFDDLLGGPSISLNPTSAFVQPKRKTLIRQMSARSEADSDAGGSSVFSSPHRSPARSRAGSESYFGASNSPKKQTVSPSRALQASNSAPEVDPANIFAQTSRPNTPDLTKGGRGRSARPAPPSPPANVKRTYGQNRTILAEVDITDPLADLQAQRRPDLRALQSQSNDSLSGHLGADSYDNSPALSEQGEEEEEADQDMQDSQSHLNNVNQLRSAGGNRRFTDEMNYMLDGLAADQSIGLQRSSAIEVIRKLRSEEWVRQLRTYDCVLQVYERFLAVKAGEGDRILGTSLVIFLSRMVQDPKTADLLLHHSPASFDGARCLDIILRILQTKWAKADFGVTDRSVSKAEARMLKTLHDIVTADQKARQSKVSVRFLIFNILAAIAMHKLPSPYTPAEVVFKSGFLDIVVDTLALNLPKTVDHGFPDGDTVEIDACLCLIEHAAADIGAGEDTTLLEQLAPKLCRGIVLLVAVAEVAAFSEDDDDDTAAATGLLASALKLLVTACTISNAWAEAAIASKTSVLQHLVQIVYLTRQAEPPEPPVPVPSDGDTSTQSSLSSSMNGDTPPSKQFDLLCLSLGLLESLLDNVESARATFRMVQLAHSSGVTCIARLYADLKPQAEQAEKQLLAKLCFLVLLHSMLGDPSTQETIGSALQDSKLGATWFVDDLKSLKTLQDEASVENDSSQIQNELRLAVAKLETFVN